MRHPWSNLLCLSVVTASAASADVLAFTDFDDSTIGASSNIKTGLNWTLNGLEDPGDMAASNAGGNPQTIFDGNAFVQDIFIPGLNTGNGNTFWTTEVSLTVAQGALVTLTDVTFNSVSVSGAQAENVDRRNDYTVSLLGPSGALIDEVTVGDTRAGTAAGRPLVTFDLADTVLSEPGTYILRIKGGDFVEPGETGNHTGLDNLSINGAVAANSPIRLWIRPNTGTPGHFDFEWDSRDGMVYDLVSADDLSAAADSWAVWDGRADLAATPPLNSLTDIPGGGGLKRFFAVVEREAPPPPPLLSEDFEGAAAIPDGWSADDDGKGTAWEVGDPSTGPAEGPDAAAGGTHCAGTNITAKYTSSAVATLTSPSIAIPAGGATLSFQQYIDTDTTGDVGAVRLLDADNSDAEIIGGDFPLTSIEGVEAGWTPQSFSLPAEALGKNVKLRFEFTSDDDTDTWAGFYIDDVLVEE